jgi:hypothetical protein
MPALTNALSTAFSLMPFRKRAILMMDGVPVSAAGADAVDGDPVDGEPLFPVDGEPLGTSVPMVHRVGELDGIGKIGDADAVADEQEGTRESSNDPAKSLVTGMQLLSSILASQSASSLSQPFLTSRSFAASTATFKIFSAPLTTALRSVTFCKSDSGTHSESAHLAENPLKWSVLHIQEFDDDGSHGTSLVLVM